jgi:hypothetical protein
MKDKPDRTKQPKMSAVNVINMLDILVEYPALREYIKNFNGVDGFIRTVETEPARKQLQTQMGEVLDANHMHSGASYACGLRGVQAVYNGTLTREELEAHHVEEMRYIYACRDSLGAN